MRDCDNVNPNKRKAFEQPVLQTAQMFVGEMGCWLVVGLLALRKRFFSKESPSDRGYEAVNTQDRDDDDPLGVDGEESHKSKSALRGYRVTLLALPAICDSMVASPLGPTIKCLGQVANPA